MKVAKIQTKTVYHANKNGLLRTTKEPLYRLKSRAEEERYQKKLGRFLHFYYGTDLTKCCGVYPKLITDQSFDADAYYICLVCGKESAHCNMPWLAKISWEEISKQEDKPLVQMTIFDLLETIK